MRSRLIPIVLERSSPQLTLCESATEYHPYVLEHLKPVLDIMAKHEIVVESYGPLSPLLRHPTGGPIKPVLERVAARLSKETGTDVDAAMALLLWTRAKNVVAVTASGNENRIAKLARTQDLPDLTADEVAEIEELGRKIHFRAYVRPCRLSRPLSPSPCATQKLTLEPPSGRAHVR